MPTHVELSWLAFAATLVAGGGTVAGVSIGAMLLARRSGSRAANVAFGAFLLVASALVLYVLLLYVQPPGEHLAIVFAPLPVTFALGPLLYAYVRARLGQPWPGAVHWVLPVLQAGLLVGIALAPTRVQQLYMGRVFAPWGSAAQVAVFVVGFAAYLRASWQTLSGSTQPYAWSRARAAWLRRVVRGGTIALGAVVAFSLVGPLFPGLPGQRFFGNPWVPFVETLLYSAILYATALGGWVQADVGTDGGREAPGRKEHYNVGSDSAALHAAALERLVREERPHLDPDLTLGSLAAQLGVTDKVLSYLFNEILGTTYSDYVNALRVDEARRRLADPVSAPLTVLAIGLDAGFASKSTFNRVFKEVTGETPSAYRQRVTAEARERPGRI